MNSRGVLAAGLMVVISCAAPTGKEMLRAEADFKPVLEAIPLEAQAVRPGESVGMVYQFRNLGATPADRSYRVFVHFEREQICGNISFQQDHEPLTPTNCWQGGEVINDGPHRVYVPIEAQEGEYWIHVGLYDAAGDGRRIYETYSNTRLMVSDQAPARKSPPGLPDAEMKKRQDQLKNRLSDPVTIDNGRIRLAVSRKNGAFHLTDLATGELWSSGPFMDCFCEATLSRNGQTRRFTVDHFKEIKADNKTILLKFHAAEEPGVQLSFRVVLPAGEPAAEFSFEPDLKDGWRLENVRLLCDSMWVLDSEKGYVIAPSWIGRLFPADSGLMFTRRLRTFAWGSCQIQMIGMVKNGSACLVSWNDPYVDVHLRSTFADLPIVPGRQMLSTSFELSKTAAKLRVDLIGRGGYVELARAYRELAKKGPYFHHWSEKLKENPEARKFFGAPDFKPFVLSRTIRGSRFFQAKGDQKEITHMSYTFDEAAQVAEHLRNDLGIERGLFVLAGWIHRGYDNQHPDILPAAPECGGNEGLADASRRIRACGYLFGLHDNYQDMYRDAPSWDEDYIEKRPDGTLQKGGNWAGGQAWITCSKKALDLAKREKTNLPMVKKLFSPTAYFIDTTFAAGLQECCDPNHPMTRWDDMKWKGALSDYARSLFGVHGSEMGMEWAIPHSHYFEGILSRRGKRNSPTEDSTIIPLFELIYHDCIAMYTHQGDRAGPDDAEYILYHLSLARMPLYRFGSHLYWKEEKKPPPPLRILPGVKTVERKGERKFSITYEWRTEETIHLDMNCFVHFTDAEGEIKFQDDHKFSVPTTAWTPGKVFSDGPREVEIPEGLSGLFDIQVGLLADHGRVQLSLKDDDDRRYKIGRIRVTPEQITLRQEQLEIEPRDTGCFARGWGDELCPTDAFIKNTYEFLSPTNELAMMLPMTDHRFLTEDQAAEMTVFGDNEVRIVVNAGPKDFEYEGARLPAFGFVVTAPAFIAYHATRWRGEEYKGPTLIAMRSLDGKPLTESRRIRLYRAFGEKRTRVPGFEKEIEVERERILTRP